jgi:hypothetical protein
MTVYVRRKVTPWIIPNLFCKFHPSFPHFINFRYSLHPLLFLRWILENVQPTAVFHVPRLPRGLRSYLRYLNPLSNHPTTRSSLYHALAHCLTSLSTLYSRSTSSLITSKSKTEAIQRFQKTTCSRLHDVVDPISCRIFDRLWESSGLGNTDCVGIFEVGDCKKGDGY